jgi:hypothetical protein
MQSTSLIASPEELEKTCNKMFNQAAIIEAEDSQEMETEEFRGFSEANC